MTAVIVYSVFEVLVLFSELNFDEIGISRKVFLKEKDWQFLANSARSPFSESSSKTSRHLVQLLGGLVF